MPKRWPSLWIICAFCLVFPAWAGELRHAPGWEIEKAPKPIDAGEFESKDWFRLTPPDGREAVIVEDEWIESIAEGQLKVEEVYEWKHSGRLPEKLKAERTPTATPADAVPAQVPVATELQWEKPKPLLPARLVWGLGYKGSGKPAEADDRKEATCVKAGAEALKPLSVPASGRSEKLQFTALRLDPGNLGPVVQGWQQQTGGLGLFRSDLQKILDAYARLGIKRLIVSQTVESSDRGDLFYYLAGHSARNDRKIIYTYFSRKEGTDVRPYGDMHRYVGALRGGSDFLQTLFQAAQDRGLEVILGIGPLGEPDLLADLDKEAAKPVPDPLTPRLAAALAAAHNQAKDLASQFGQHRAFGGWLINSAARCIDTSAKFYGPLAKELKTLTKDKPVIVGLSLTAESCEKAKPLQDILRLSKGDVSAFFYEDGLGIPRKSGNPVCANEAACGTAQLAEVKVRFEKVAQAHSAAGTSFWIETQGWRDNSRCDLSVNKPWCHVAPWSVVERQLDLAKGSLPPQQLVLGEGFLLLHTQVENSQPKDPVTLENVIQFTNGYIRYLWPALAANVAQDCAKGKGRALASNRASTTLLPEVDNNKSLCKIFLSELSHGGITKAGVKTEIIGPSPKHPSAWDAGMKACPMMAEMVLQQACVQPGLESASAQGVLTMTEEGGSTRKHEFSLEKNCR